MKRLVPPVVVPALRALAVGVLAVGVLACGRPGAPVPPAPPSHAATAPAGAPEESVPPEVAWEPADAGDEAVDDDDRRRDDHDHDHDHTGPIDAVGRAAPRSLPRCLPSQLNTPCVYERGGTCFERRSNCDRVPCTEMAGPHPSHPLEVCARATAPTSTGCDIAIRCSIGVRDLVPCEVAPTCRPRTSGACITEQVAARILAARSCADVDPIVRSSVR